MIKIYANAKENEMQWNMILKHYCRNCANLYLFVEKKKTHTQNQLFR